MSGGEDPTARMSSFTGLRVEAHGESLSHSMRMDTRVCTLIRGVFSIPTKAGKFKRLLLQFTPERCVAPTT